MEDFSLHQVLGRHKWNEAWSLAFAHLHCLRETSETLQRGRGLETPGAGAGARAKAGQGAGLRASCTCSFVEEGAREAVKTLEAAGVDAHSLLPLPRLAVLGTRGHGDLGWGGHEV